MRLFRKKEDYIYWSNGDEASSYLRGSAAFRQIANIRGSRASVGPVLPKWSVDRKYCLRLLYVNAGTNPTVARALEAWCPGCPKIVDVPGVLDGDHWLTVRRLCQAADHVTLGPAMASWLSDFEELVPGRVSILPDFSADNEDSFGVGLGLAILAAHEHIASRVVERRNV